MKYESEMTIDLPRQRVVELFDDPDNLSNWQLGLKRFELVSGEAGQPGAKSRLEYDMDGRQIEMIETIERRALPEEFTATYEANGVWNRVTNRFYETDAGQTRWVVENEFRFSGWVRILSLFVRGSFRAQTKQNMMDFKAFAESGGAKGPGSAASRETP
jgi:uncharacterized protein YndB with AHSA1/START domain